jgi:hypothetical protein
MWFPRRAAVSFSHVLKGANLFGRGSSDMKSGLAAMIHAAAAEGFPLRPPLFAADRVAVDVHGDVAVCRARKNGPVCPHKGISQD